MAKQLTMFAMEEAENKYAPHSGSPLYVPKDRKPVLGELRDGSKARTLERAIAAEPGIGEEERQFLREAAQRHVVFNYELCADYYVHASPEMQRLMEESALVIVDINDAIERGYVQLTDTVRRLYVEELAECNGDSRSSS